MSIQWTMIAGYLYVEIAVVTLLMLPIFSARRWNRFFKSHIFSMFQQHAATFFKVLLGVLCLFLSDAIRDMKKYSHDSGAAHVHLASEMKGSVKLFRAQRNFYITGFSIFLAFVIRKLVSMIIIQDELKLELDNIINKDESSVNLATENINNQEELSMLWLEKAQEKFKLEQIRTTELQEEVKKWKGLYEQANAVATLGDGKGDEKEL